MRGIFTREEIDVPKVDAKFRRSDLDLNGFGFVFDRSQPGASEAQFYVDGVAQPVVNQPNNDDDTGNFGNEPLFVTSRGGTLENNADGLDDMLVFARALSPEEIGSL